MNSDNRTIHAHLGHFDALSDDAGGLEEHRLGRDAQRLGHGVGGGEGISPAGLPGGGIGLAGIDEHGARGGGGGEALAAVLDGRRGHLERSGTQSGKV